MTRIFIGIILSLTLSLVLLGWYTKNLHADYITEKNNNISLEAVALELEQKLERSNEVSKEFQKQLSIIDRKLASIRVRNNKTSNCIILDTGKRGSDGSRAGEVVLNGNGRSGLSVDWLYDYAGRCEKTRQKALGLQNFVRNVNQ